MNIRLIGFAIVAWIVPACIAGALGWNSIWGGGSALPDYLIPFPTAGGMLHIPSFVAAVVLLLARQSGGGLLSALSRPLLIGMILAGLVLMLDLNAFSLAMTTDVAGPRGSGWFTENPLGLFMLSDGVLAQFWLPRREFSLSSAQRRGFGAAAALLPPLLAAGTMFQYTTPARNDLMPGTSRDGPARGDNIVTIYSTMGFEPAALEAALAKEVTLALPPDRHVDAEDQAVYFFDSLQSARDGRTVEARMTWCRYEDGTPARWTSGEDDCFSHHVNFSEKLQKIYETVDKTLSPDVRLYAMYKIACKDVRLQPEANFSDISEQRRCSGQSRTRDELLARSSLSDADRQVLN